MEFIEIQNKIISGIEEEIPGINFQNLLTFEVIDFKFFKNKSKREFVNWYVQKASNVSFSIESETFGNNELSTFKMICEKLKHSFDVQYNMTSGFQLYIERKEMVGNSFETLGDMLTAARYLNLNLFNTYELQYMFKDQNEIKNMITIIRSLATDKMRIKKRMLIEEVNLMRTKINTEINVAFEKILSEIFDNRIKNN